MQSTYRRAKLACYAGSVSMSAISCLSPLLFLTFHETYGISYTLLGLLAVFCFGIQLAVDLVFSFFARYFNIQKTVRYTPVIAFVGLVIYAAMPVLFPEWAYFWLVVGTLISSVSAGLCEVLLSPVVAAIPSENPEHEMSKLHSMYAWGVVGVVIVSTLLLKLFTPARWYLMAGIWALVPLFDAFLFFTAKLPPIPAGEMGEKGHGIPKGMLLCVVFIFLGGASEVTMTQWCSSFLERALGISKTLGDIFGLALFAALLGLGRSLYAKHGKNISRVLLFGMLGAFVCYVVAAFSPLPILSLVGCVLTGFFTSMLWPGTLIYMEEKHPNPGVVPFALMAAGGDAGASLGPQMVGAVVDAIALSPRAAALAERLSLSAEQLGFKVGVVVASLFPLLGIFVFLYMRRYYARKKEKSPNFSKTVDKS